MDGLRLRALEQSLPFAAWYATSPHSGREAADGDVDLLFGNPHDMPIPAYVEALKRHAEPSSPAHFAYMFNHPDATAVAAAGLRRHTGLPWDPADFAMTNSSSAAI